MSDRKAQPHVVREVLQVPEAISSKEKQHPHHHQRLHEATELLEMQAVCGDSTQTTAPASKCKFKFLIFN
jgi:hypothetical protein